MTVTFGEYYVFSIRRGTDYDNNKIIHNYCLRTATMDVIEIDYRTENQEISGIDCMLCASLWEGAYTAPDCSKLKKLNYPENNLNPNPFGSLEVCYNSKEMNLCFDAGKNYGDIDSFYSEGRVDFFYDSEGYLLDIRVRDLSAQEYQILRDEHEDYGHYMKK